MRLAFADTRWYVADPAFSPAPAGRPACPRTTPRAAPAHRSAARHPRPPAAAPRTAGSDTVYLSVVDGEGNACSFINSNYMGFGTGIVPRGWGFTLQNRGHNFSLDPEHPNALAPGKRPYHTIIPALATRESRRLAVRQLRGDGRLHAAAGTRAGDDRPCRGRVGSAGRRSIVRGSASPTPRMTARWASRRGSRRLRWPPSRRWDIRSTHGEGPRTRGLWPWPGHHARSGDRRAVRRQRSASRRPCDGAVRVCSRGQV